MKIKVLTKDHGIITSKELNEDESARALQVVSDTFLLNFIQCLCIQKMEL